MSDPRVYFAAERTLLAWVRTGVTVIGLGFVVARFGLFLRLINPAHPDAGRMGFSGVLGVCLAIGGGILTALAGLQFTAFLRELRPEELPRARIIQTVSLVLAFAISGVGGAARDLSSALGPGVQWGFAGISALAGFAVFRI